MISLPYDEGFSIYVDGEKVETKTVFDCFLGFDIDKGLHTINIVYMPIGLVLGAVMSLFGIISLLLFYYLYNKNSRIETKKEGTNFASP